MVSRSDHCAAGPRLSALDRVRAKLSSAASGRWASSGRAGKFGLSVPDLLPPRTLRQRSASANLRLLCHFHVGARSRPRRGFKDAPAEAGQIYVQLAQLGASARLPRRGGGLGIVLRRSRTATAASTNYSLQNYATDWWPPCRVAGAPTASCPARGSETGRAIASHFSVLVFDRVSVLGHRSVGGAAVSEGRNH